MILAFFATDPALQTYPRRLFLLTPKPTQIWSVWSSEDRPFFLTCQVKVVRFYVSCPARLPPPAPPPPPPRSQCSPGPEQQPLEQSVPRRTLTASSRSQRSPSGSECSPPDLNHKEPPNIYQIECQKKCQNVRIYARRYVRIDAR